jgi:hypothetical protein
MGEAAGGDIAALLSKFRAHANFPITAQMFVLCSFNAAVMALMVAPAGRCMLN